MEITLYNNKSQTLRKKWRRNTYYTIIDTKVTSRDSISIIEKD